MNEKKKDEKNLASEVSRRDFIKGAATGALAVAATGVLSACATPGAAGRAARGQSPIFEPTKIGTLTLKNKIIRSAMAERRYDANGNPTRALLSMFEEEAAGGIGMLTTGGLAVWQEDAYGDIFPHFTNASQIPAYREVVDIVHRNGAKICAQIMMNGTVNAPFFVNNMSNENVRRGVSAFAHTARLAQDAGFDAVEFHFAHGYLAAQFWSHFRNSRTDEYGGSVENRARFAFEVLEATRRAVGRNFPLIAKINSDEHSVQPGSSQAETNFYVQGLADRGIDAVKTSGFAWGARFARYILSREDQNFFSRAARAISRSVDVPLILVGGIRNVDMAEEALRFNDKIVALAMGRTILAEPDLPLKWQNDPNYNPQCTSCQWCIDNLFNPGHRTVCVLDRNRT